MPFSVPGKIHPGQAGHSETAVELPGSTAVLLFRIGSSLDGFNGRYFSHHGQRLPGSDQNHPIGRRETSSPDQILSRQDQ